MKKKNIVRALLGLAAVAAIVAGIAQGDVSDVLRKATAVCLECIGIG